MTRTRPTNAALALALVAALGLLAAPGWAQGDAPWGELEVSGSIRQARDPVIIEQEGRFYLFTTGPGIPIRCSDDLLHWDGCGLVSIGLPSWARELVPGATAIWAPDVSYFADRYHVYYSVSTFGSNVSAIGLFTSPTLDRDDPDYAWTDHGPVIASTGRENWNAIDPNLLLTPDGDAWLVFGSFWSGIKAFRIDPTTGKAANEPPTLIDLASRHEPPRAIEAPFVVFRDGFYYLFVSFDHCCRGVDSDYNVRVGRATDPTGPYLDRDGTPMLEGGGTLLVGPSERWPGSGHNAVFHADGVDYLAYHGYDADFGGSATLRIEVLAWDDDGWPIATGQP